MNHLLISTQLIFETKVNQLESIGINYYTKMLMLTLKFFFILIDSENLRENTETVT
jgi:hypothetical protein